MRLVSTSLTLTAILLSGNVCFSQDTSGELPIPKELQPKLVTIEERSIPLSQALAELRKQTGVAVADRRGGDDDPKIILDIHRSTFWKSLDAIARAADVQLALFEENGGIAIANRGIRSPFVDYQGVFRISAKRVDLQRNFVRGGSTCTLAFDVAWEPRFEPLYMEVGPSAIVYSADKNGKKAEHEMPGRGTQPVSQRSATEFDLSFPGSDRSSPKIASLHGKLVFIGPTKMLAFEFNRLVPISNAKDVRILKKNNHEVRLTQIVTRPGRWTFDVEIIQPASEVKLQSFQSWMHNNRIMLVKDDGAKKSVLLPKEEELLRPEEPTGAAVKYHFVESDGQRLGKLADWRLIYRTPGRIVRFVVPYSFKDIPLP